MARTSVGKHKSTKFVLVCVGLLGFALIADLFWASSSSSAYMYLSSNWPLQQSHNFLPPHLPNNTATKGGKTSQDKKDTVPQRVLSATFSDLPAPELQWEKMATAPVPRLDGAALQIKDLLFVFAGYGTIDYVHSHVDVYNLTENTWGGRFDMPKEMAHSHLGMVTDGRYIYVVTGQYGPQCRGPTARTFVLDTETKKWQDMPNLPVPRYAPATQLWKGRLHVMGGSKENRHTPGLEHWSLGVKDGKALEKEWRSEIPIPRGGPHRPCTSEIEDVVTENDLEHLLHLIESKDGVTGWQSIMERSTSNLTFQAWRHDPETGPAVYCSRTVFEDATPELVRDFFWDDEFRPKWDPMLAYFRILEEHPHTGTTIVHWIKKFPFFCSDREYIIGRRIWEDGKTYYCVTKGVPYPALQRHDKPRRVDLYFSSWIIKPVQSRSGDGQLSACEVTLIHYEDMGIPKDVAKLGVRHGMWGTVKKLHSGFRSYQQVRKSEAPLSRSALMARITTKISSGEDTIPLDIASGEEERDELVDTQGTPKHGGIDWKWVVIGGTVALVFGLQTGVIRKALFLGAWRRVARR